MNLVLESFFLLCLVLDGLTYCLKGEKPPEWGTLMETWYATHQAAHPDAVPKPKHHLALHLASQDGTQSCFVLERKHRKYKQYAKSMTVLQGFEKSISFSLLNEQLRMMEDESTFLSGTYAVGNKDAPNDLPPPFAGKRVRVARQATHEMKTTCVGDAVFFRSGLGQDVGVVRGHFVVDPPIGGAKGHLVALDLYALVGEEVYRACGSTELIGIEAVISAAIWSRKANGDLVVLKPPVLEYAEFTS